MRFCLPRWGWPGTLAAMAALALGTLASSILPAQEPARPVQAGGGLSDLVAGLKSTPGCLGVESARTESGKSVIFVWFENKKAVVAWYRSGTHRSMLKMADSPGSPNPLKHIPDDAGPLLVIASMTPATREKPAEAGMPYSQVSVEMYQPLPGGASFGGTFAPAGLKIPEHKSADGVPAEAEPAAPTRGEPR